MDNETRSFESTQILDRGRAYGSDALWFRAVYADLIRTHQLTVSVRPGDRSDPQAVTHLNLNVPIPVRVIRRPGN